MGPRKKKKKQLVLAGAFLFLSFARFLALPLSSSLSWVHVSGQSSAPVPVFFSSL